MDLLFGYLQHYWQVWCKTNRVGCLHLPGILLEYLSSLCWGLKNYNHSIWNVLLILQAAALLLFNTADKLSYSEIMTQLNVSHDDLIRLLHSLSCAKYKIIIKEPNTKAISPDDTFQFNSKFTDRMRRIKVYTSSNSLYNAVLLLYLLLLFPPVIKMYL